MCLIFSDKFHKKALQGNEIPSVTAGREPKVAKGVVGSMRTRIFLLSAAVTVLVACTALVPPPPEPSPGHLQAPEPAAPQAIPPVVERAPYLPPPQPAPPSERYTVVVHEVPVKELLFALARDAKVNVDIDPGIEGVVTLNAIDQTLPQILDRIARQADVRYEIQGKNVIVGPDRPYLRTYKVDYVNLSRDATGTVDIATQIISTGADIGDSGGGLAAAGENNSTTKIKNTANNRFWLTLTRGIMALVGEPVSAGGALTELPVTGSVIPNPESGIITVRATAKQHEAIQRFLDQVMTNAQRQVLIEATVVEVALLDRYQQGIDWNVLLTESGSDIGLIQTLGATVFPPAFAFGQNPVTSFTLSYSSGDVNATLRALREFGDVKVLSSPRVMALNNQTAILKVVENVVFFEIDVEPAPIVGGGVIGIGGLGQPAVDTTAKTVPVGFIMALTPQISEDERITLNVRPTISRITQFVNDPNPELVRTGLFNRTLQNPVPQIAVREMESVLRLQNGQTGVLGGLIQDQAQQQTDSVPLLSDIPVLGDALFRGHANRYEKVELVIFLRPIVIQQPSLESDLRDYRPYLQENVGPNRTY